MATASFVLMVTVFLFYSYCIRKISTAHFAVICHFYCAKARFYKCLCLCILNPGCVRQKECGVGEKKIHIGFLKEIFSLCGREKRTKGYFICKRTEFEKQILGRKV